MIPTEMTTLDRERAERLAEALADAARASLADGGDGARSPLAAGAAAERRAPLPGTGPKRYRRPALIGVAATAAVLIAAVALAATALRPVTVAEARPAFATTSRGAWVDIVPVAYDFDADAAVEQLRSLGFRAERGTYTVERDARGDVVHRAAGRGGLELAAIGVELPSGGEVMLVVEGPVGATLPEADGRIDWDAAAEQFGFRNPVRHQVDGFVLRRDSTVTIRVLTAP